MSQYDRKAEEIGKEELLNHALNLLPGFVRDIFTGYKSGMRLQDVSSIKPFLVPRQEKGPLLKSLSVPPSQFARMEIVRGGWEGGGKKRQEQIVEGLVTLLGGVAFKFKRRDKRGEQTNIYWAWHEDPFFSTWLPPDQWCSGEDRDEIGSRAAEQALEPLDHG